MRNLKNRGVPVLEIANEVWNIYLQQILLNKKATYHFKIYIWNWQTHNNEKNTNTINNNNNNNNP